MDDRNKLGTKWFHLKFIKNMRENTQNRNYNPVHHTLSTLNPAPPVYMFNPNPRRYIQVLVVLSVLLAQI